MEGVKGGWRKRKEKLLVYASTSRHVHRGKGKECGLATAIRLGFIGEGKYIRKRR